MIYHHSHNVDWPLYEVMLCSASHDTRKIWLVNVFITRKLAKRLIVDLWYVVYHIFLLISKKIVMLDMLHETAR